jgi:hypothetical protein
VAALIFPDAIDCYRSTAARDAAIGPRSNFSLAGAADNRRYLKPPLVIRQLSEGW